MCRYQFSEVILSLMTKESEVKSEVKSEVNNESEKAKVIAYLDLEDKAVHFRGGTWSSGVSWSSALRNWYLKPLKPFWKLRKVLL